MQSSAVCDGGDDTHIFTSLLFSTLPQRSYGAYHRCVTLRSPINISRKSAYVSILCDGERQHVRHLVLESVALTSV